MCTFVKFEFGWISDGHVFPSENERRFLRPPTERSSLSMMAPRICEQVVCIKTSTTSKESHRLLKLQDLHVLGLLMTYRRHKYGLGIGRENLTCADLQLSIRKHHWICNKHTKGMFACKRKDENRQSPMSCQRYQRSVIHGTWGSISSHYDYIWSCGISFLL